MSAEPSTDADPLALYDELAADGRAPPPEEYCRRYPEHPSLLTHIRVLLGLRRELVALGRELAATLDLPADLGGFKLLRTLGRGGMGTVYLAQQACPRRLCALKVLSPDSGMTLERFRREANLPARLCHPGIATVFNFGVEQGLAYLATELVYGVPLRRLLAAAGLVATREEWLGEILASLAVGVRAPEGATSPMPIPIALDLAVQAAEALGHAHERGVVHRDIKPSNIMVSFAGAVKLIDFGIAVARDGEGDLTRSGAFLGTFDYAAPEQLRGDRHLIGPWSDTYALGATLFEMLTQRTPFLASSWVERAASAGARPTRGPRAFNAAVPSRLEKLVLRALEPEHERRFSDGHEMAEALRECARAPRLALAFSRTPRLPRVPACVLWVAALTLLATSLIFGHLYVRARAAVIRSEQAAAEQATRAGHATLIWALEQHRRELAACLSTERSPSSPSRLRPRIDAEVTVVSGNVSRVELTSFSRGVSERGLTCVRAILSELRLPGVGLDESLTLPVAIDVAMAGAP